MTAAMRVFTHLRSGCALQQFILPYQAVILEDEKEEQKVL
jgi:hypothetical protein